MRIPLCIAHLDLTKTFRGIFQRRVPLFFLFTFLLTLLSSPIAKEIQIALLDTPSCPSLIENSQNITIKPVVDLTQNHSYKCYKATLNKRLFHGHWVLENLLKGLKLSSKVTITPLVVFDGQGNQKIQYWKRAFDYVKENDIHLVISAAGFPLIDEELVKEAMKIEIPKIPMLLAIGRKSPFLNKEVPLFPHIHHNWQTLTFGSYHKAFDKKDQASFDLQQFESLRPSYVFPFEDHSQAYPKLKGSSLAVSLGGNFILQNCQSRFNLTNSSLLSKSIKDCLDQFSTDISFKNSALKGKILSK